MDPPSLLRSLSLTSSPTDVSQMDSSSCVDLGAYWLVFNESLDFSLSLQPDSEFYSFGVCAQSSGCDSFPW